MVISRGTGNIHFNHNYYRRPISPPHVPFLLGLVFPVLLLLDYCISQRSFYRLISCVPFHAQINGAETREGSSERERRASLTGAAEERPERLRNGIIPNGGVCCVFV